MRRDQIAHDGMRMPAWMRRWVYLAAGASLLTGALWLLFHHFVRRQGEFGAEAHPLEHVWLTLHGGAAIAMAWVLGLVWLAHVRRGWQRRRNHGSGITLLAQLVVLAMTGWGLYYLGDEVWRDEIALCHWLLGLAGGVWLPFQIWRGRRSERSSATSRANLRETVRP